MGPKATFMLAFLIGLPAAGFADVTLPNVFSDHAMLQRALPVPIWGNANAGESVTVKFADQSKTAAAGSDGKWKVILDALQPGGPLSMTVSGKNTITRNDIWVGDVWICAGQSNMGTTMAGTQWWMSECPGANVPGIHFLNMGGNGGHSAAQPQSDQPDQWYPCTPATAFSFSAVGYFFAKAIYHDTGVPIGMIKCSSWRAPAEPFVPADALRASETFKPLMEKLDAEVADYNAKKKDADAVAYAQKLQVWQEARQALDGRLRENDLGLKNHWNDPATDVSHWDKLHMPGNWQGTEFRGQSGSIWLRRETSVPLSWLKKELLLQLGDTGDDEATVFFNGVEIGKNSPATEAVGYRVPAELVRSGSNTIVMRISGAGAGGDNLGGNEFLFYLAPADGGNGDERMPLPGDWKYKVGAEWPQEKMSAKPVPAFGPAGAQVAPASLWNGMLSPIASYGIKGVLWYQGESNDDRAEQYNTLFPLLITSWRHAWGQGDFPFLYVQLPNFISNGKPKNYQEIPPDSPHANLTLGWAPLREAQLHTLAVPHTAMAVTIDIGDPWQIHPNNKKTVADRLVLAALAQAYGKEVESSGPTFDSFTVEGDAVRIKFQHAQNGLVAKDGPLRNFAVAGDDQKFFWATATLNGNSVVVNAAQVAKPVAVRYAFFADPEGANLFNAAGLPAGPFRTDHWTLPPDKP